MSWTGVYFADYPRMANRPSRLRDFPYIGEYRYFLTICTQNRAPVFEVDANARCAVAQILRTSSQLAFDVIAYCVMPDHVHALVAGMQPDSDFQLLAKTYKQVTGHWWKQTGQNRLLWQEGFHDRVLREDDHTEDVVRYILLNPVRAGLVTDPRDYPYLGAAKYDVATLLESVCVWEPPWRRKGGSHGRT